VPRRILGAVLLLSLPLAVLGQDKSKKAYELIYQDVQVLKEQVQDLRARLDRNAEEIRAIRELLKTLADLVRQSTADQAGLKDDLRAIPAQYQDLLRRIDQLSLDVEKVAADLAAARAAEPVADKAAKEPAPQKKPESKPGTAAPPAKTQPKATAPPASNISPGEAYRMAYNDYLKGNYGLAVESFKLYRQQFPDSPLADNALYWIGECHFSEKKYEEAIDDFNEVILAYPQGDKVAAAHLKKGISFMELGKKDEALAAFKLLVSKFPLQEETKIAQDKIRELTEK
jgi:tol-pal system protein YbgF